MFPTSIQDTLNKTFYHTNMLDNSRNSIGNSKSKLFSPVRVQTTHSKTKPHHNSKHKASKTMVDGNLTQYYEKFRDKLDSSHLLRDNEDHQGVVPPPSNNDRRNNYSYL